METRVDGDTRERTVRWQDPVPTAHMGAEMSGLEYMRAIAAQEVPAPPIAVLMGFRPVKVEEGEVSFSAEVGEHLYNPIGVVHGGLASTLLDSVMGCAVHSTLPKGDFYTTLELKVNFVRAITREMENVLAHAKVVHLGGRTATVEGRVETADGRLLAHGTSTCLITRSSANGAG